MLAIVVGGGQVGTRLATLLLAGGYDVKVVESGEDQTARQRRLPPEALVHGSGTDPSVLEAAGVRYAEVVAAVTGTDETNLVVTSLARFEFRVPRTIARVNDPENAWMFSPVMGVDVALNQADLMAHLIAEEMSLGDMVTLLKLRKGQYSLVEEKVHPQAPASGRAVRTLSLPEECTLVAVIRQGDLLLPRPELVLQPMDEVLALVHSDQAYLLAAQLSQASAPDGAGHAGHVGHVGHVGHDGQAGGDETARPARAVPA